MTITTYFYLPDKDDFLLELQSGTDYENIIQVSFLLLSKIKKESIQIFYDEENVKNFLSQIKDLTSEQYLSKPENKLSLCEKIN